MTPSQTKRAEFLDALADHLLAHGMAGSSLKALAEAAGTSDRMLLYYFDDKADLMDAALTHIAGRLTGMLQAQVAEAPVTEEDLKTRLVAMALDPALWPYLALWLELATLAARGDAQAQAVGGAIGQGFLQWIAMQVDAADDDGRVRAATRVLASVEGALLLKALGLEDQVRDALLP